jgi:hypothetical protein
MQPMALPRQLVCNVMSMLNHAGDDVAEATLIVV